MAVRGGLVVLAFCLLGAAPVLASPDPAEVARRVHEQGGYPDNLTVRRGGEWSSLFGPGGGGSGRPDSSSGPEPAEPSRSERGGWTMPAAAGASVVSVLVLVMLGVGVVALVVWLVARASRGAPPEPATTQTARPRARPAPRAPAEAPASPGDPEALAAEGRFDEAIAALLHRALQWGGWRPHGRDLSRTAREILAAVRADDPRRGPLEDIVRAAEAVRFGGAPADRTRFEELQAAFGRLRGKGQPA
jgi:hypothetical protein